MGSKVVHLPTLPLGPHVAQQIVVGEQHLRVGDQAEQELVLGAGELHGLIPVPHRVVDHVDAQLADGEPLALGPVPAGRLADHAREPDPQLLGVERGSPLGVAADEVARPVVQQGEGAVAVVGVMDHQDGLAGELRDLGDQVGRPGHVGGVEQHRVPRARPEVGEQSPGLVEAHHGVPVLAERSIDLGSERTRCVGDQQHFHSIHRALRVVPAPRMQAWPFLPQNRYPVRGRTTRFEICRSTREQEVMGT